MQNSRLCLIRSEPVLEHADGGASRVRRFCRRADHERDCTQRFAQVLIEFVSRPRVRAGNLRLMESRRLTSARELRAVFNAFVWPRIEHGELDELVLMSGRAAVASGQPHGTMSELVGYYDSGRRIAVAHRFVMPDGGLGGSGRPDPKEVRHDGELLRLRR